MFFYWIPYFEDLRTNVSESLKHRTGAATGGVLCKKVFLKIPQNSQENTGARASFFSKLRAEACNFIKRLAQVFRCEFWEISKNIYFTEHLRATTSDRNIFHPTSFKPPIAQTK